MIFEDSEFASFMRDDAERTIAFTVKNNIYATENDTSFIKDNIRYYNNDEKCTLTGKLKYVQITRINCSSYENEGKNKGKDGDEDEDEDSDEDEDEDEDIMVRDISIHRYNNPEYTPCSLSTLMTIRYMPSIKQLAEFYSRFKIPLNSNLEKVFNH